MTIFFPVFIYLLLHLFELVEPVHIVTALGAL